MAKTENKDEGFKTLDIQDMVEDVLKELNARMNTDENCGEYRYCINACQMMIQSLRNRKARLAAGPAIPTPQERPAVQVEKATTKPELLKG